MGQAIGQSLPFAVGVAISPMPIVAVVLMLVTPSGRKNGPSFLAGWIAGIAAAGTILLLIASPADPSDSGKPAEWVSWLKLVLGVLLLVFAAREWRARPQPGHEPATPKWMAALDAFSAAKAAGTGVALSVVNPKNLLLIVGAATAVAATGSSGGSQAAAWAVFTLVASIGVSAPIVIYFALGSRASSILAELNTWMVRNNTAIMAVLCLIIGVKLIGDAISGLS